MKGPTHRIDRVIINGMIEERRAVGYACNSGHRQSVWARLADAPTEEDIVKSTRRILSLWFGDQNCGDCNAVSKALAST